MTLHRPEFEKDSCGFGLVAHMDGQAGHALVRSALVSLGRLSHRGGVGADPETGDGCGLLMRRPERFLRRVAAEHGWQLPRHYAAGLVFFDGDAADAEEQKAALAKQLARQQVTVCGWRELPLNPDALGVEGRRTMPLMAQVFAAAGDEAMEVMDFERRLFTARVEAEAELRAEENDFFVCSLSSRVLVYKGMMLAGQMEGFYADLMDPDMESSLAVFHQRFSTNTLPRWKLAQPYRFLAHNGEINTIQGNRSWSYARRGKYQSPLLPAPRVTATGSDSLSLDNMLEYLWHGGLDVLRAVSIMIPPAWQNVESMDEDLRAFYRYHSTKMESWDGPAGIVLSDGRYAVCAMDRNGLRPARYSVTRDRRIILASETGVSDAQPGDITAKGRLMPGEIIAADTRSGELLPPDAIRERLKSRRPYKRWLKQSQQRLQSRPRVDAPHSPSLNPASLAVYEKIFQVSAEERTQVVRVLAEAGQEAVGSMGDDTPIAVLSRHDRSLFDFFRQQFAQVTNPPIDPLREQIVMSLETCLGRKSNVFDEGENDAACVVLRSPVLSSDKLAHITALGGAPGGELYRHRVINLSADAGQSLPAALDDICRRAEQAVRAGDAIVILSDRELRRETWPVHALLATGAVHRHLSKCGLRGDANLIVDTAVARDPHHFAVLIGFGATAVHPWLAYEIILDMLRKGEVARTGSGVVLRTYRRGIIKGLYKIMSRMGISTVASYRAAKLFEVLGLSREVVDKCFHGAVSRIQGIGFAELEEDAKHNCRAAWNPRGKPQVGGLLKYVNGGEYHACNPDVVRTLHRAVASGDYEDYREFAALVNERPPAMLRDLLRLKTAGAAPLPLPEVESEGEIMRRFDSAGMSLGALSPEAHEALAEAMNSIGGRSNSGEGGEDPARYGTARTSKIKQVASGRFGVTPAYLVNAEILQIKIAQGAKPGEGGQLPGPKVNPLIAGLRYSSPGVALISPPPHHDIYSIEDLAQLIYDLKQVNPEAMVSVKLVAAAGVGTIAVGVAKCHADLITIAGYDGGTGASPLTSVKYSGVPWEMGIAETHQALRAGGMRGRVRLQADGGLKSGLDVVKAAILGAESFGFGTMPMVALGCKYLRICHLNNCATGVATQHPTLRKLHFAGSPQRVVHYFNFVAREVREILAQLGARSLRDVIGRVDLLENAAIAGTRHAMLDLQPVLAQAPAPPGEPQFCTTEINRPPEYSDLGARMVDAMAPLIAGGGGDGREFSYTVRNVDRAVGARLSGIIARRHDNQGMEDNPLTVRLRGAAGQSFGAWNAGGLHMFLRGEANDYVGKGMAGGKLVLAPPPELQLRSVDTPIIGNTCLYGATGGKFFAAGCAGERFAVRNSGAQAVVEGVGDHGCEYMTGGAVAVLGRSGLNFGAGMTGGIAFVLDMERNFVDQCNKELVDIRRVNSESTEEYLEFLYNLVSEHAAETGSAWGRAVRDDFADLARHFRLVSPRALDLESLLSTLMQAA
ncbi:MAG: glutamate synthase large subunit [Gammaproteobacteria bacterium]|nr:glutamate synthase large subunit [Gammaproteobacteria bacterium]